MYRRNSVNINELINRYEPSDDDFSASENVKYLHLTRPKGKLYALHDETAGYDENSLIKYNENFFSRNKNNITMTGAKEMTKNTVAMFLQRIGAFLEMVSKFPFPRMSVLSFGLTSLLAIFICPRSFTERALYPGFKILFTIIYPAYRSFKAVRNKNLKEYLKWIVYWIVYAFFTCLELLTDAIMNWFPFYFEIKVIFFIWLLGPTSRGAMKFYRTFIHPTLLSREQEIDSIIQIAQDRGYMHVLRLGSQSFNYANKIIMQEAQAPESNQLVSHQMLMRNISLSNISDAGTIQSNDDVEEVLRLRKFSSDRVPYYDNQFNYTYEHLEQRRKPRYDEISSSGFSSPDTVRSQRSRAYLEDEEGRENYFRNIPRNGGNMNLSEMEKNTRSLANADLDAPRRKTSINELSEKEIVLAYNKLRAEKNPIAVDSRMKNEDSSGEMKAEFLKWLKMQQSEGKTRSTTDKSVNAEKVNIIDETENRSEVVDVIRRVQEEPALDVKESIVHTSDFDDFKDIVSEDDDYLNVPLVIHEDVDEAKADESTKIESSQVSQEGESRQRVEAEKNTEEEIMIDAKMTLSNSLEVKLNLSSSSFSLASDKSGDETTSSKKKKRRAPQPPSTANEVFIPRVK